MCDPDDEEGRDGCGAAGGSPRTPKSFAATDPAVITGCLPAGPSLDSSPFGPALMCLLRPVLLVSVFAVAGRLGFFTATFPVSHAPTREFSTGTDTYPTDETDEFTVDADGVHSTSRRIHSSNSSAPLARNIIGPLLPFHRLAPPTSALLSLATPPFIHADSTRPSLLLSGAAATSVGTSSKCPRNAERNPGLSGDDGEKKLVFVVAGDDSDSDSCDSCVETSTTCLALVRAASKTLATAGDDPAEATPRFGDRTGAHRLILRVS